MKYTKEYKQRMRVAKKIVLSNKNGSTSYLQRKLQVGYNYADMLMEDISKQRGFGFVYRYRRKIQNRAFRKCRHR
jgi:hypothetical protein